MKMVIGGAFEGKTSYAKRTFGLKDDDIADGYSCTRYELYHCRAVKHAEELVRRCIRSGEDPMPVAENLIRYNPDVIIIANEIGCGVIPVDSVDRKYRELAGRFCTRLATFSDEVHRVTYGQGIIIKKTDSDDNIGEQEEIQEQDIEIINVEEQD
ncbi:MAG: bifunctional adenosylcobinamide kinase/adenosylcobinamide-phosphate guanylyltransferase [Eubacteriales bacterium]